MHYKIVFLVLFMPQLVHSQIDSCIRAWYNSENDIVDVYSIYKLNIDIKLDELPLLPHQISQLRKVLRDTLILQTIKEYKKDSVFAKYHNIFNRSEMYEGYEFQDYLLLNSLDVTQHTQRRQVLSRVLHRYLIELNAVNISMFYRDEANNGEFYFYEDAHLYDGLFTTKFKYINNPTFYSVYYSPKASLNANIDTLIGYERGTLTQTIVFSVVSDGEYICDVRMTFCNR